MNTDQRKAHEAEFHQFDEDVRGALFGPVGPGGSRVDSEGVVARVAALYAASQDGSVRAKLAASDKLLIGLVVAVVEIVRTVVAG